MGGFRVLLPLGIAAAAACSGPAVMDFSENSDLYRDTEFHSPVPADRAVFVAPVVDRRQPQAVEAQSALPLTYLPDGSWDRPVPDMVDRIVRREIESSGVFAEVHQRARPQDCILQVSLLRFEAAIQEQVAGRRSLGAIALHVRVYGPLSAGVRPVLLDRDFGDQRVSEAAMSPPNPRLLLGMALNASLRGMLGAIDQANVARSNVPLDDR